MNLLAKTVLILLLALTFTPTGFAGGGPENVALVVNTRSWASRAVANEYVRLRQIPAGNIITVDLSEHERIGVDAFREQILRPALETIERRGLAGQIDYLIYSADLPTAIDVRPDLGNRQAPQVITPVASINGLTYLYRYVLAENPNYLRLDINRYVRRPLSEVAAARMSPDEQTAYNDARKHLENMEWAAAAEILTKLAAGRPLLPHVYYNLACCQARLEQTEAALLSLKQAVSVGWSDAELTKADPDLTPLREREEFSQLLDAMNQPKFQLQPTVAFRAPRTWNEAGQLAQGTQGEAYLLSSVLAVTSGRGNSVAEALAQLKRSAAADGTRPNGTIYFCKNSDVRTLTRERDFAPAVEQLRSLGAKAEIIEGNLPSKRDDVAGVVMGIASFNWSGSGSTILPGAICEHLTSFGGVMTQRAGQTPLTDFLRAGAAGSSGTVTEPYAIRAKFPLPYIHTHYVSGCSLAESFYQSVQGPYQLLVVGDPLCQPWAVIPPVTITGIKPHDRVSGTLELTPGVAEGFPMAAVAWFELFVDGRRIGACAPWESFPFDTTKFDDGHHELRIVAVGRLPLETQGRAIVPLVIENYEHKLTVSQPEQTRWPWDRPLRLRLSLPKAQQISVFHGRQPVATLVGNDGEVTIDLAELGPGPVTLQPIGLLAEPTPQRVFGPPITFDVVAPLPLPGVKLPADAELKPGLLLTAGANKSASVIDDLRPNDWLSKQELAVGTPLELNGYFEIAESDIYQFQVRSNLNDLRMSVDGQPLPLDDSKQGWQFLPVSLGSGLHQVTVTGVVRNDPQLDVRFGGPGAESLSQARFRHRPTE